MNDLRSELQHLARSFVRSVLGALVAAPIGELVEQTEGRRREAVGSSGGQRAHRQQVRRANGEFEKQKQAVLAAAMTLAPGFRRRDITKIATIEGNLSRALFLLVSEGKLRREGDRNKTRYWLTR